jgi:hypothetical protein
MSFAHRSAEMRKRGYDFALAHVETSAVAAHLDPRHHIELSGKAVMMPMWIRGGTTGTVVVAILGSEPRTDAPEVSIPRSGFLSITTVPWNQP